MLRRMYPELICRFFCWIFSIDQIFHITLVRIKDFSPIHLAVLYFLSTMVLVEGSMKFSVGPYSGFPHFTVAKSLLTGYFM